MFSHLSGSILTIEDGKVDLIATGTGLGFEILVPIRTLSNVSIGEVANLFIHHHITDVSEVLFGFETREEKALFRKLLKVSGVWGKTALAMLSMGTRLLIQAIDEGDEKFLSSLPGIGKKMALKIIVELKHKVSIDDITEQTPQTPLRKPGNVEITDTLLSMGYDRKTVERIVEAIPDTLIGLQDRMVYCIKNLAK
ncbi:MAG: Holliday junction ATP-dependent DNA helicase ruvA [uncultured bacterium (gcode 4)]|uniref:Holliday junction branch migration complex subunit RuvA n=1 Tax=uncultured bacterium (gcode 4) TaxID=1234023 RepID=K1YDQ7_9BACT|nr:MAG: Holliday junction ATP-dependent DNA helicase ruvA [uncultured bacterium (gcode 4)]